MSTLSALNRAADRTMCTVLQVGGQSLIGSAVWLAWNPTARLTAAGLGALAILAAEYGCPPIEVDDEDPVNQVEGCQEVNGTGTLWYKVLGAVDPKPYEVNGVIYDSWTKIRGVELTSFNGSRCMLVKGTDTSGDTSILDCGWNDFFVYEQHRFWLVPNEGSTCKWSSDDPHQLPPDAYKPITYVDVETNCTLEVTFQGFVQEAENGPIGPVYLMQGVTSSTRADGGIIGGCNFPPIIFYPGNGGGGGGGGGPIYIPVPDNPPPDGPGNTPWWLAPLIAILGGAALQTIIDLLNGLTQPTVPESSFTMIAPCDLDEEENPQQRTWEFPASSVDQRLHAHQVALMEMLQQHLNWKTPVCPPEPPVLKGDWRTISFISDEPSPYGKSRLRKRFRYRSSSGIGLDELIDHWADFTWQAGPVCVKHSGAPWGYPQVWAASIDEGKRVIQHAATEAGFDANQVGRWEVGGSSDGRYGVPGTMRVRTDGGYFWITARDGSDMRPLVGKI